MIFDLQTLGCILFTIVIYVMSAQPYEWGRFLMFLVISLLVTYVAQSIGLLIGAAFSVTVSILNYSEFG
jgi:hypothetical protein